MNERMIPTELSKAQVIKYAEGIAGEMGCRVLASKFLGGGSFGRAVKIVTADESFVIKLLLSPGMLEKEVFDLSLLQNACPVPMPKVLFTHPSSEKIPVDGYAMTLIPGKSALLSPLLYLSGKGVRMRFADEVTSALHAVHCVTNGKFGDTMHPDHSSWDEVYRPFARDIAEKTRLAVSAGELPQSVGRAAEAAWERYDDIFCEEVNAASLIHGDLNTANIMVSKRRLTGLIDPLNCMWADREYDLFQFDNLTGKRFSLSDTYIKKYGASKMVRQKLAFYGLFNEVYCFFKSGALIPLIMNPLVKNMFAQLKTL